jgi:hypothetical protein
MENLAGRTVVSSKTGLPRRLARALLAVFLSRFEPTSKYTEWLGFNFQE